MTTRDEALEMIGEQLKDLLTDSDYRSALEALGLLEPISRVMQPETMTVQVSMERLLEDYEVHPLDRAAEEPRLRAAVEADAKEYGIQNYKDVQLEWGEEHDIGAIEWTDNDAGISEYSYTESDEATLAKTVEELLASIKSGELTEEDALEAAEEECEGAEAALRKALRG